MRSCTNFIAPANILIAASRLLFMVLLLSACSAGSGGTDPSPADEITNATVFEYFHQRSEQIYDGNGSWGKTTFGYRMALRDSYWRADVNNPEFGANRFRNEAKYFLRINADLKILARLGEKKSLLLFSAGSFFNALE